MQRLWAVVCALVLCVAGVVGVQQPAAAAGVTWTAQTAPEGFWNSVTYGNGLFVAVGDDDTNQVMTSPDGVDWTAQTAPDADWVSVTYGDGLFVAVGDGTKPVMTSPDGVTWTAQTAPDTDWYSVTYGNGLFVAVGDGTKQVMTSGKLDAQVTVNARKESKKLTSGKKYKVVRSASTNATLTKANARCYLNGKRLKGKSKRALCRTKVKNTGSNVVITAKPLCSSGLSIRAKIVANDPNMAKASFKRTWAVKKRPSARGDILSDCQKLLP
ncbi:MAG: hypothetical protein ACJAY5_000631 [Actinomycetes bacterium]|jgi:hypothetical protein